MAARRSSALLALLACCRLCDCCTTLVAARGATTDGSVLAAHSNDGDGITVGNVVVVPAKNYSEPWRRVSGGSVPQVAHTYAYYTKVGGYASINEHQVGLAESTCSAVLVGQKGDATLNIVDLSALGLERARTARSAVMTMGSLAMTHGYYDAGESLIVVDPNEAWIFHVLPDNTSASAVWVAQRVPDGHVGVVANSFTVRVVDLEDTDNFLYSANMLDVARWLGHWRGGSQPFDFTRIFAGAEPGHKYASGRRMWAAYRHLAPAAAAHLSPEYTEYVSAAPYPATLPAANVTAADLRRVMRDYYERTPYDLSVGMAAGPLGSPTRWSVGAGVEGSFERPIAIQRTILSYVLVCRSWLPEPVGGVLWLSFHSALFSVYTPMVTGLLRSATELPRGFTSNSGAVDRGVGAWQAAHFVFAAAQLDFASAILAIREAQAHWEGVGEAILDTAVRAYTAGEASVDEVARRCVAHAANVTAAWWALSDELLLGVALPAIAYPRWWLNAVNYSDGPPPSPEPPRRTRLV